MTYTQMKWWREEKAQGAADDLVEQSRKTNLSGAR